MSEPATGAEPAAPNTSEAPPDPKATASAAADPSPSSGDSTAAPVTAAPDAGKTTGTTASEPTSTPAEVAESARLRAGFAKLADKEAALHRQNGEFKAARESASKFAELQRLAQEDPAALLEHFGGQDPLGFFEKLLESAERKYRAPAPPKVEDELAALRKKVEDREAAEAEARRAAETATAMARIEEGKRSVAGMVAGAGDEFELVNAEGAHGLVWNAMLEWAELHKGAAIPPDLWRHAAAQVEQTLAAENDERIGRLGKTKRYSSRFAAAPEKPAPSSESASSGRASSPETLTNTLAAGAPPPPASKKLSRAESEAETLAWLKAQRAANP